MSIYSVGDLEVAKEQYLSKGLPDYMWPGVRNWLQYGQRPGHFLTAVIEHDLFDVIARADDTNRALLQQWVWFFHNDVDSRAHGEWSLKTWPELHDKQEEHDETQSMGKST